ncbi:coiled-coil domain-containing protein 110 isoform X1 [Chelonoidis abingdonii]|uniref:coiled-coil domain-containing protein 110 isoform X1 n=1 Tax=Chelonoidis abingdonii TaxID=106734 RepID=UPI0013F1C40B|nr:coiled-coil domain-containing protein 110 isoform X1 [Chelonoidis abingdonii]
MRQGGGHRKDCEDSSGGSRGQETDPLSLSVSGDLASCEEAGPNNYTSGIEGQIQPQSALKILQQQLKSFQALRQQTLLNVNMVQSEISEILNKNIIDVKTPQCSPDKLLMTGTPPEMAMPTGSPETPLSKKKFHLDKKLCSTQSVEANSSIFGNVVSDVNISHQISLKAVTTGKIENSVEPIKNKTMIALKNDCKSKDYAKYECFLPCTNLEAESMVPPNEKVILDESKARVPLLKYSDEHHLIDNFSYSIKPLKGELQKSHEQELAHAFGHQNISCSQSNVFDDMSEQDQEKSALFLSREKLHVDLTSRKISESEESADSLHVALVSLKGNNLSLGQEFNKDSECDSSQNSSHITTCSTQTETETKNRNKELRSTDSGVGMFQLNVISKTVQDKLLMFDHIEKLQKEKEKQLQIINQRLLKLGNQDFYEIGADEYTTKMEELQNSLKDSKLLQKKVMELENENVTLKSKMKPLTVIIRSLTERNSQYEKQIKDLVEEKKSMQVRLVKSEGDSKECIKEVKKLLKKCKELQDQKKTLEGERSQLCSENQCMMQALDDFKINNQKAQENMIAVIGEKDRLFAELEFLQKESSVLQEANQKLEIKTSQLAKEKNSLEKELEKNQIEIRQLKEKENVMKSEQETLVHIMQSLKDKKLDLEMTLQECANARQTMQQALETVQSDKAYTEEKLLTELQNTKAERDILKTNLLNMNREWENLSTVVANITEDNQVLKKNLQECKQDTYKYENNIRTLNEDHLLMENHLRTIENERDVLQFEFRHLHKDYVNLRDQITVLVNKQHKHSYISGKEKYHSMYSTEICEEISDYRYTALESNPQENGKIAEIRKKLEEEELQKDKMHRDVKKHYSAISVSCTTSVIKESSFRTTVKKTYSTVCSAI